MFDAGFWELLIIGVLALVIVGPERLPRLARTVGLWVGRARHAFYSVRDEIEREANAEGLRDTQRAVRESMKSTERELRSEIDSVGEETHKAAESAREGASGGNAAESRTDSGASEEQHSPPDSKHG